MQRTDLLCYRYEIDTNWTMDVVLGKLGYEFWLQQNETYVKMWCQTIYYEMMDFENLEDNILEICDFFKEVYLYNTRE